MTIRTFARVAVALSLSALAGCEDFDPCDADAVRAALEDAQSGDVVELGACQLTGPFTVPAGVTLRGQGVATTILVPAGEVGVRLTPGSLPAIVADLAIESEGAAGVVVIGAGAASIRGVTLHAIRGIGIGAQDVTGLSVADVALTGPVSADTLQDVPDPVDPSISATHGLVLVGIELAELSNVTASGFADFGVLSVESNVVWSGGSASDNLGTGAMIEGGSGSLANLELCGNLRGGRAIPPYGLIVSALVEGSAPPTVDATDVHVCGNEGVGVLVTNAASFSLAGVDAVLAIEDNVGVGMLVLDSANITLTNAEVTGTTAGDLPLAEGDIPLPLGDGIQLIRTTDGIAFEDVAAQDNERSQLLLDLGDAVHVSNLDATWTNVTVDALATNWGARCQGTIDDPAGESWLPDDEDDWDLGIERDATTLVSDQLGGDTTDVLSTVSVGGPCNMPVPGGVAAGGLSYLGVQ